MCVCVCVTENVIITATTATPFVSQLPSLPWRLSLHVLPSLLPPYSTSQPHNYNVHCLPIYLLPPLVLDSIYVYHYSHCHGHLHTSFAFSRLSRCLRFSAALAALAAVAARSTMAAVATFSASAAVSEGGRVEFEGENDEGSQWKVVAVWSQ